MPRVIALMNQKGGVGKTTTTVNLGAAIASAGKRVLLVDLDPQSHLTLHVGIDGGKLESTAYDLLLDNAVSAFEVVREVGENLAAIPSEVGLAGAEPELARLPDKHTRLKTKLDPLLDAFDYILIDCPPSLGLLTLNALAAAGEVIVPMQAHFLALQGLSKLLESVQLVRKKINPSLTVSGVVLAMHEGHTRLASEVVGDLERFFDSARKFSLPWSHTVIFQPPIRRNIKLAECPSFGQTIFQYEPACPGAVDYRSLADSVMAAHGSKLKVQSSTSGAQGVSMKPVDISESTTAQAD